MDLLIGYDLGSSSIKASVINAETGELVGSATSPSQEMEIMAAQPGWAEQKPEVWWSHIKAATAMIKVETGFDPAAVKAIGISYQMHGLVVVDEAQEVLRPSIIWCDSRAVGIGDRAAEALGEDHCLKHLLNLPGNFTASKLRWVQENEPEIYKRIHRIMLPGDFVAMKLTGEVKTTVSGLSEGMLWDFSTGAPASFLMEHYALDPSLIPEALPTFGAHGELSAKAAAELGLQAGTPVTYRGGDQPNNALSLNVLNPGEVAVTAGTSGVVYGISDQPNFDPASRVNVFAHVNHAPDRQRLGVLLCVNGTGILNSWLKRTIAGEMAYKEMDQAAGEVAVGSDGLLIHPYGNGAERTLTNRDIGASVHGLNFNTHGKAHFFRAAQEGIVFALNYGMEIMRTMGTGVSTARAGFANMFMSPLFASAFATVTGAAVELYNTDGAQGAARGAGIGAGLYTEDTAFAGLKPIKRIEPDAATKAAYQDVYGQWKQTLERDLG